VGKLTHRNCERHKKETKTCLSYIISSPLTNSDPMWLVALSLSLILFVLTMASLSKHSNSNIFSSFLLCTFYLMRDSDTPTGGCYIFNRHHSCVFFCRRCCCYFAFSSCANRFVVVRGEEIFRIWNDRF